MSAFKFRTIVVKGDGIRKEGKLSDSSNDITPGMFVKRTGHNFTDVLHCAADSPLKCVAVENEVFGTGIDEVYDTEGENVLYHVVHSGCEVFALLHAGRSVAVGALLETVSGGTLEEGSTQPIACAMEAVDNSGGSTPKRILVEIL